MKKIQEPCFFYNTGGCYNPDGSPKSEAECKYLHTQINKPVEKGQHLRAPCKYYHLRGECKNKLCLFGHIELSYQKWTWYFPNHFYPGKGYTHAGPFKKGCKWVN